MINVDELFEKRYGGKTARQYFEENESFTPIEMVNFAKHCIEQLNKPAVMQAASECVSGAAVGNSAAGKGVRGGIISCPSCGQGWDLTKHNACSCGAQLRGELLR
jgi:hypothetical protein